MVDLEAVRGTVEPVLDRLGLELVDAEIVGSGRARTLRLAVDRPGGVDLDALAQASAPVSAVLDEKAVVSGPYTLEVSSPGLERPLRNRADFARFVGTTITVKSHEAVDGARRHRGPLLEADDEGVALEVDGQRRRFAYEAIATARTVFEWGPPAKPKPGKPGKPKPGKPKPAKNEKAAVASATVPGGGSA
ncbi:MAG: ribosome maturation factor RimP [Acidimicrobiia bacterium]